MDRVHTRQFPQGKAGGDVPKAVPLGTFRSASRSEPQRWQLQPSEGLPIKVSNLRVALASQL